MPEHQQIQQSKTPDTIFQKKAIPANQTPVSNPYSIIQRAKINPKSLTRADIMQLQRTIGNQAVGRLLSGIGNSSTAQQATVQRQEIPEEEKACPSCMQRQEIQEEEEPLQGKMIETVQRQEIPEEEKPLQGKMIGTIQRQEIPEEEEPLQGKFENKPEIACPSCFVAPIVQKQEIPEEEEPLQGKMIEPLQLQEIPEEEEPLQGKMIETIQRQEIPEEEEPLQTKRENNTGMPDSLKAGVENLSGIDMNDVRVHYNSSKPAEVGALAYTQGTDIHVAPGQERHLGHEAWHVVQQKQGRVQPTMQLKDGIPVNDDEGLENEADVLGRKALQQYAQLEKPKENKSQSVANTVSQKQSGGESTFQFVDNRPEVIMQRHGPGPKNVEKSDEHYSCKEHYSKLIPRYLKISNLFRGDSRKREGLKDHGFEPGNRPIDYVEKLKGFLKKRSDDNAVEKAEQDARAMISRERGPDINPKDGKEMPTYLVYSSQKIEISGGRQIFLLNYVCTGTDTGAGSTSYLIKVEETFECISASPNIGLYQSPSGMQIVAVEQSAGNFAKYANFTEYDFLTTIPAERIYYASKDGGRTQVDNGDSWFCVKDRTPR